MTNEIIYYLIALVLASVSALFFYKMLCKILEKRRIKTENKLKDLVQREKVTAELDRFEKRIRFLVMAKIAAAVIFIIVGAAGIRFLIEKIVSGDIKNIFNGYNYAYYLISPLIFIAGIITLIRKIRVLTSDKKEVSN